ncbi:DUF378 domain-containing protein [Patescibacteria group bacterium]
MKKPNVIDWISFILVIVGGLNWGLVGAFDIDLVAEIFGTDSTISTIVYILVGVSAVYTFVSMFMKMKSPQKQEQTQ